MEPYNALSNQYLQFMGFPASNPVPQPLPSRYNDYIAVNFKNQQLPILAAQYLFTDITSGGSRGPRDVGPISVLFLNFHAVFGRNFAK